MFLICWVEEPSILLESDRHGMSVCTAGPVFVNTINTMADNDGSQCLLTDNSGAKISLRPVTEPHFNTGKGLQVEEPWHKWQQNTEVQA